MSLNDGLKGYWSLDEASGNNRVDKINGNDLLEFLDPVPTGAGKNGTAAGPFVTLERLSAVADVIFEEDNFTWSCWVKFDTLPVFGTPTTLIKIDGSYHIYVAKNSGPGYSLIYTDNVEIKSFTFTFSTATWYNIIVWKTDNVVGFSINGSSGTVSYPHTVAGDGELDIGHDDGNALLDGLIDELAFWDRVLTTGERSQLYNGGTGLFYLFPEEQEQDITFTDSILKSFETEYIDTITLTDSINIIYSPDIEDEITFGDVNEVIQWYGIIEEIVFDDELISLHEHIRTVSQTITFSDSITVGQYIEEEIEDTITFSIGTYDDQNLLLEDGFNLLLEDGFALILEGQEHNFKVDGSDDTITFSQVIDELLNAPELFGEYEDTITFSDVNSHQHLYDSVEDTITFTDEFLSSLNTPHQSDTITFAQIITTNFKVATTESDLIFTQDIDRNDITHVTVSDIVTFSHANNTNIKPVALTSEILFFDTIVPQAPFKESLTDTLTFTTVDYGKNSIRETITDTITFSDTNKTNVKILDLTDVLTLTDQHIGRGSTRRTVTDTIIFTHSHTDIYTLQVLDAITFTDQNKQNLLFGEVEDTILFANIIDQHGSIYVSVEDEITFTQFPNRNTILAREVEDCICFSDQAINGRYGDVEDTITFSDEAANVLWEEVVDTLSFSQSNSIEGIDFASYLCAEANVESTLDEVVENGNDAIPENVNDDPEIVIGPEINFQGIEEVRDCSGDIQLLYQVVSQDFTLSDSVNPFGDRGITVDTSLDFNDFLVGFIVRLRT
jgi:hypothetical protein